MTLKQDLNSSGSDRAASAERIKNEENSSQRLPLKPKRHSLAIEVSLPNIDESEEGSRDDINEEDGEESPTGRSEDVTKTHPTSNMITIFQTEVVHDSDSSAHSTDGNQSECKRSPSDRSSSKSDLARVSVNSLVAHVGDRESFSTPGTSGVETNTLTPHNYKQSSGSSKTSVSSVKQLDIRNVGSHDVKQKGKGGSNTSQRSSETDTSTPGDFKLPRVKCVHGNSMNVKENDGHSSKTVKVKANNPCLLCEVTDEAHRMTQTESNKLLLEIVYPHEFYDQYSRAKFTKKTSTPAGITKESLTICKPAKVVRKISPPERYRVPPATSRVPEESGVLQYGGTSPEKRRKQEQSEETEVEKKEIHLQCKPKMNALVITDNTRGQKMVLKGLKGWILRKHDGCQNKIHRDIKQSLYQVGTLGMKFGLPEYNTTLHDRKPVSPRPATCMTSRSQDNGVVVRPNTHSLGPRQRTMPSLPRDLVLSQTRGFGVLHRDLTNIPPRLPTTQENSAKQVVPVVTSSQKCLESSIARVLKSGLSLPPIKGDVKAHP